MTTRHGTSTRRSLERGSIGVRISQTREPSYLGTKRSTKETSMTPNLLKYVLGAILAGLIIVAGVHLARGETEKPLGEATVHMNEKCTAFHISEGYMLTAGHCIESMGTSHYTHLDDPTIRVPINPLVVLKPQGSVPDLAVMTYKGIETEVLTLACDYEPKAGDFVSMVGYPLDIGRSQVWGRVMSVSDSAIETANGISRVPHIVANLAGLPGFSGSALQLEKDNTVIGIASVAVEVNPSVTMFTPVSEVCKWLKFIGVQE